MSHQNANGIIDAGIWLQEPDYGIPVVDSDTDLMQRISKEWEARLRTLRQGLDTGTPPECAQVERFCSRLIAWQRLDLPKPSIQGSWCLEQNDRMGSDARVDFLYFPTYAAVAILALTRQRMPEVARRLPALDAALRRGLVATCGRNLAGHGYESNQQMTEAVELLALGQVFSMLRAAPDLCPRFVMMVGQVRSHLQAIPDVPAHEPAWSHIAPAQRDRALAWLENDIEM